MGDSAAAQLLLGYENLARYHRAQAENAALFIAAQKDHVSAQIAFG